MSKKILYINQYFKHPSEPGITRSYWTARRLIEAGYSITMLAHRNTCLGHVGETPLYQRTDVDGIEVIYLRNQYSNDMGMVGRAWAFVSFMFRATYYAAKEKDVDLVIATSTPLTVAAPALFRLWFRKTPYIFEVRDLWPDVPVQMGAIKNKYMIRFLRWFEKITYRKAEHVIALSPGMVDGVVKYIPKSKTSMIPNMAKIDAFWPRAKEQGLMEEMGLASESFKVIYFGQMGLSNAIDYIVDAAALLERYGENIEFLFVGHGRMMKVVRNRMEREGLKLIHLFERVPMREMSEIVNFCDVSLVTFSDIPILYTNSPNKLFDSLSAGKPIIVNSAGWTKEMVETHDCGLFADPKDPLALAEAVLRLKNSDDDSARMGANARRLAETVYDKSILCDQFRDVVDRVFDTIEKRKHR